MSPLDPYDGVLVVSFGGPERPEEVLPFMRHVTRGKGIPDERLTEVSQHYYDRGGRSPINDETRALVVALELELGGRGIDLPVLWGNRHAAPFVADALAQARDRGLRRLVVVLTSAYSSYSSCRQYREDLAEAVAGLTDAPEIAKIAPYAPTDAFREPTIRLTLEGLDELLARDGVEPATTRILAVTHSIPAAMDAASGPPDGRGAYVRQHREVVARLAERARRRTGHAIPVELVYCSRSGPPRQPWLEPDVNDAITAAAAEGVRAVLVAPVGFVADHMEVVHDLDTEAARTAREAGVEFLRTPTVRDDPGFASGLVDLLVDRAREARHEARPQRPSPLPSDCPAGCCPNPRGDRPALCGED